MRILVLSLLLAAAAGCVHAPPATNTAGAASAPGVGQGNGLSNSGKPDQGAQDPITVQSQGDALTVNSVTPAAPVESPCQLDGKPIVHFDTDSDILDDTARQTLAKYADCLHASDGVVFRVSGYCDRRGSEAYNDALSARRSAAVANYLRQLDPALNLKQSWCGVHYPVAGGLDANRRAVLFPEQSGDPCLVGANSPNAN